MSEDHSVAPPSRNGSRSNFDTSAEARKKSFLCDQDNDKCPLCKKNVFKVESKVCAGLKWHQSCFGKNLNSM